MLIDELASFCLHDANLQALVNELNRESTLLGGRKCLKAFES